MKKIIAVLAALLSVALLTTGCFNAAQPAPTDAPTTIPTDIPITDATNAPAPTDAVDATNATDGLNVAPSPFATTTP